MGNWKQVLRIYHLQFQYFAIVHFLSKNFLLEVDLLIENKFRIKSFFFLEPNGKSILLKPIFEASHNEIQVETLKNNQSYRNLNLGLLHL